MLSINNKNDVEKMMKYHRTKDMLNLLTYFPEISPIRNLTIIESVDDYNKNYQLIKDLPCERNDTIISKPSMKSVESTGVNSSNLNILKRVKEIDPDGVLVLFNLCHKPSNRYERYAGISVGVSVGEAVYIDAVGRGFDGREVSKGLATHERYFIPWFDLRKCNIDNFTNYRTYLINEDDYQRSRNERIDFLCSVGFQKKLMEEIIPKKYMPIPDFIWLDVIINLIKKLEKMEDELLSANLTEFAISGHTEGKKYYPWQIFDKSRYKIN